MTVLRVARRLSIPSKTVENIFRGNAEEIFNVGCS